MQTVTCATCGIKFCLTDDLYRRRYEDGEGVHCPHGHVSVFRPSEAEQLRGRVAELEKQIAWMKNSHAHRLELLDGARIENDTLRDQLTTAKLRAAGYKRQWLRVKDLLKSRTHKET